MPQTAYDLCSRALVRVGGAPITSFTDGTNEAIYAGREYEPLVDAMLSGHRWRFATAQETLVKLEDTPEGGRWQHGYQLPSDLLLLHGITVGGVSILYDRYGDKIFANHDDTLVADYTFRVDEARWPGTFADAMVASLAEVFARSLARDAEMADAEGKRAQLAWQKARTTDSQAQTTRRLRAGRLLGVR